MPRMLLHTLGAAAAITAATLSPTFAAPVNAVDYDAAFMERLSEAAYTSCDFRGSLPDVRDCTDKEQAQADALNAGGAPTTPAPVARINVDHSGNVFNTDDPQLDGSRIFVLLEDKAADPETSVLSESQFSAGKDAAQPGALQFMHVIRGGIYYTYVTKMVNGYSIPEEPLDTEALKYAVVDFSEPHVYIGADEKDAERYYKEVDGKIVRVGSGRAVETSAKTWEGLEQTLAQGGYYDFGRLHNPDATYTEEDGWTLKKVATLLLAAVGVGMGVVFAERTARGR